MTLIVAAASADNVVLASDRRFTINGRLDEDDSHKMVTLACRDSRAAVAFTGLGYSHHLGFRTGSWLPQALADAARGIYTVKGTLEQFAAEATGTVNNLRLPPTQKHLTIIVAGYLFKENSWAPYLCFLSNWEDPLGNELPNLSTRVSHFTPRW
jgi:hypothetical protein